jgi:hypothetical protein
MKHHEIKSEPNQKINIPECWKCHNRISEEIEPGVDVFIGCTKCDQIKSYKDAKKYCPLPTNKPD